MLHLDLKSANVLLDEHGVAKVRYTGDVGEIWGRYEGDMREISGRDRVEIGKGTLPLTPNPNPIPIPNQPYP